MWKGVIYMTLHVDGGKVNITLLSENWRWIVIFLGSLASEGMNLQREVLDINCSSEDKFPDL